MRLHRLACLTLALAAACAAAPAGILEDIVPAEALQEMLDLLEANGAEAVRGDRTKRNFGILRQLLPSLSQIVDPILQQLDNALFRTLNRADVLTRDEDFERGNYVNEDDSSLSSKPTPSDDDDDGGDDLVGLGNSRVVTGSAGVGETQTPSARATAAAATTPTDVDDSFLDEVSLDGVDVSDDEDFKRIQEAPAGVKEEPSFALNFIRLLLDPSGGEHDEEAAAADDEARPEGEGVPGPLTRLLVVANRGLADLIQQFIVGASQTAEKLVNLKARIITSLI